MLQFPKRRWVIGIIGPFLTGAIIALTGNAAIHAAEPAAQKEVTIAFWNIQWFPGGRPSASAGAEKRQTVAVHTEMQKLNPDILGMEEVRNWGAATLAVSL